MNRCKLCVIPDTRPDTQFIDGVCTACLSYQRRPQIDWDARKKELIALLDRHHGECIVPSSGGKDSTAQVLMLKELGAHVTVVTATTCHLTTIGRKNIDNLTRYATTIEVSPNKTVRAKLNRLGLEMVGDISWPEHVAIFTTPFKVAADIGIPLIFYGENPQDQYGGPLGSEEAKTMTRRWVSEFGGFLGLRAEDMIGQEGITKRDMQDYTIPKMPMKLLSTAHHLEPGMGNGILQTYEPTIEAHFLGQYLPWDSHKNASRAIAAGMAWAKPCPANWWAWENQDNAQTGIHDHMMFRKYGYGRGAAQASVDIRTGIHQRKDVLEWVERWDGQFPQIYAGVPIAQVLDRIGMEPNRFHQILQDFTNKELFPNGVPG